MTTLAIQPHVSEQQIADNISMLRGPTTDITLLTFQLALLLGTNSWQRGREERSQKLLECIAKQTEQKRMANLSRVCCIATAVSAVAKGMCDFTSAIVVTASTADVLAGKTKFTPSGLLTAGARKVAGLKTSVTPPTNQVNDAIHRVLQSWSAGCTSTEKAFEQISDMLRQLRQIEVEEHDREKTDLERSENDNQKGHDEAVKAAQHALDMLRTVRETYNRGIAG